MGLLSDERLEKEGGNLKPSGKGRKNSARNESPRLGMSEGRVIFGNRGIQCLTRATRAVLGLDLVPFRIPFPPFAQVFPALRCPHKRKGRPDLGCRSVDEEIILFKWSHSLFQLRLSDISAFRAAAFSAWNVRERN